jgi:hypothetical protein
MLALIAAYPDDPGPRKGLFALAVRAVLRKGRLKPPARRPTSARALTEHLFTHPMDCTARLALVRLLLKAGPVCAARTEVKIALLGNPGNKAALRLATRIGKPPRRFRLLPETS